MEFESMLKLMVQKNASDLFITAGVPPCMKVHGKIGPIAKESLTPAQARDVTWGIMNDRQKEEFDRTHECNFAISLTGVGRFRVSAFQQRNHIGMVLRKIPSKIPEIDELMLPPILRDLSTTKRGLIIFVGGTGTGKSTSLASMIGYRNQTASGHIITIEDPIEYVHAHNKCIITQREVGIDTESYDVALKNTLRQAPDVILMGEIRSRDTMDYAIAFAETGHLCLSTLHANNANQALERIINFFPEERHGQLFMDLSLNLKAMVAQQLLPTPDGKGRVPAVEVMINTPLMADLIKDRKIHEMKDLMKRSTELGMQTFDQALYKLYRQDLVTYDDALRAADSANELRLMIKLGDENAVENLGEEAQGLTVEGDDDLTGGMMR